MTREEAIRCLSVHSSTNGSGLCTDKQHFEAKQVAIKALVQESKWDRLYSWLNDMRFGIAPDEITPDDERNERLAQVDVIDDIMEWMIEQQESEEQA